MDYQEYKDLKIASEVFHSLLEMYEKEKMVSILSKSDGLEDAKEEVERLDRVLGDLKERFYRAMGLRSPNGPFIEQG